MNITILEFEVCISVGMCDLIHVHFYFQETNKTIETIKYKI